MVLIKIQIMVSKIGSTATHKQAIKNVFLGSSLLPLNMYLDRHRAIKCSYIQMRPLHPHHQIRYRGR